MGLPTASPLLPLQRASELLRDAKAHPKQGLHALAASSLAAGTLDTYARNLDDIRSAGQRRGATSPIEALSILIHEWAINNKSHKTIAVAVAAYRFAATLGFFPLPPAIVDQVLKGAKRLNPGKQQRVEHLTVYPSSIAQLQKRAKNTADGQRFLAAAMLSYYHMLRISEVTRLTPRDICLTATKPTITVSASKNHDHAITQRLEPEAIHWAKRLLDLRDTKQGDTFPLVPYTHEQLNKWLHTHLKDTVNARCTWHSLRHGRASALLHAGSTITEIQAKGRWKAEASVHHYLHNYHDHEA